MLYLYRITPNPVRVKGLLQSVIKRGAVLTVTRTPQDAMVAATIYFI